MTTAAAAGAAIAGKGVLIHSHHWQNCNRNPYQIAATRGCEGMRCAQAARYKLQLAFFEFVATCPLPELEISTMSQIANAHDIMIYLTVTEVCAEAMLFLVSSTTLRC